MLRISLVDPRMMRPLADRVLHALHNLAAVGPENARSIPELAEATQEPVDKIHDLLDSEEQLGNIKSLTDANKEQRYYLTGLGILRAVSMLT
jgi:predicted transcriptional regulator